MSVFTAFAYWYDLTERLGQCTCGGLKGHLGWMDCFDNWCPPRPTETPDGA